MYKYIHRKVEKKIEKLLSYFPAVAIVGPRQVGKTSLAQALSVTLPRPTAYLDLENPNDLAKLENPSLFLEPLQEQPSFLTRCKGNPICFRFCGASLTNTGCRAVSSFWGRPHRI